MDDRWDQVLTALTGILGDRAAAIGTGPLRVLVDAGPADGFTERLAGALGSAGRSAAGLDPPGPIGSSSGSRSEARPAGSAAASGARPVGRRPGVVLGTDRDLERDVVIHVRTAPGGRAGDHDDADIVVDLVDPARPVIRRVAAHLGGTEHWYVPETRAFFGPRAGSWDARFGDDLPAYAAAVAEAGVRPGSVALDLGCGTGRALPPLREAVGPAGTVLALDLTPQMLDAVRRHGRAGAARLLVGDARRLPLRDATVDLVFAAGLVQHLPDPPAGLRELGRVTRPDGRLVIFHPSGRAALAARHGRELRLDEPLAHDQLAALLDAAGWRLARYDDPAHRFLALAVRT